MNELKKYRWKIASGGMLMITLLSIGFLLLPYIGSTLEKSQVLATQKENIAFMTDWKGQQSVLKKQKEILDEYLGTKESAIPSLEDFPSIIEYLFTTSEQNNVKIQKMMPFENKRESLMERSVMIEVIGDYNGIASFINRIEQSSFIVRIEKLELIKKENEELNGFFDVSFILSGGQS